MARPAVELWWGEDCFDAKIWPIYDPEQRAMLRPKLRSILDMATDGVNSLGVELSGRKRAYFWQVKPGFDYMGEALNKTTSYIYLHTGAAKGRIDIGRENRIVVHELLHNKRMERFTENTLGEYAVAESLSLHGSYRFRYVNPVLPWRSTRREAIEYVAELPNRKLLSYRDAFAEAAGSDASEGKDARYWMSWDDGGPVRRGEIVGISALALRLWEGHSINDLTQMPAAVALGYESQSAGVNGERYVTG